MSLEQANLFIQGVIAISVIIALKQLKLAKTSFIINSQRESIRYSSDLVENYLNTIIPKLNDLDKKLDERKFISLGILLEIEKPFSINELEQAPNKVREHFDYSRKFIENNEKMGEEIIFCINTLESFATPFIERVADNEVAFKAVGRTYCNTVNKLYFLFCMVRSEEDGGYFSNTVSLYKLWSVKIKRLNLEKDIAQKNKELSKTAKKEIKTLGTI